MSDEGVMNTLKKGLFQNILLYLSKQSKRLKRKHLRGLCTPDRAITVSVRTLRRDAWRSIVSGSKRVQEFLSQ